LDIIGRGKAFSEHRFQPAMVRHDGFFLLTVGDPIMDTSLQSKALKTLRMLILVSILVLMDFSLQFLI
jgi:hypothetical protein